LAANSTGNINVTGQYQTSTGAVTVNSTGLGVTTPFANNLQTGTTTLTAGILRATGSTGALGAGSLQLNGGYAAAYWRTQLCPQYHGRRQHDDPKRKHGAGGGLHGHPRHAQSRRIHAHDHPGAFVNSTGASVAFGAGTLTAAGTINTNNSFFNSAATMTTTLASLTSTAIGAVIGGTGNTSITGGITGTTTTVTKNGPGTLTLSGTDRKYLYRRVNHQRRHSPM